MSPIESPTSTPVESPTSYPTYSYPVPSYVRNTTTYDSLSPTYSPSFGNSTRFQRPTSSPTTINIELLSILLPITIALALFIILSAIYISRKNNSE